jgi:hypothetical protein
MDKLSDKAIMDSDFRDVTTDSFANVTVLTYTQSPCEIKGGCPYNATWSRKEPTDQYYLAASCTLYPCVKDITVSVNSGVYKEKILSTVPLRLYQPGMYSQYAPRQFVKSHASLSGKSTTWVTSLLCLI